MHELLYYNSGNDRKTIMYLGIWFNFIMAFVQKLK